VSTVKLTVVPLELKEANEFIEQHHRHHKRVQGHRFSIGVIDQNGQIRGCAVVGRPVSGLDPKRILEVVRMCSDGTPNVCSMLYGAAARAGQALGYEVIQTYIYKTEHGASLKASGYMFERDAHPSGRHRKRSDGTTRDTTHVSLPKTLWRKELNKRTGDAFAHHRRAKKVIESNGQA